MATNIALATWDETDVDVIINISYCSYLSVLFAH